MSDWQPSAPLNNLRQRARIINVIRQFFAERDVLEVETPTLSAAAVSDPHLFPFAADFVPEGGGQASTLYLHTSPEYPMKRLLAVGSGCIWQLCRVYRNGETGHFTLTFQGKYTRFSNFMPEAYAEGVLR